MVVLEGFSSVPFLLSQDHSLPVVVVVLEEGLIPSPAALCAVAMVLEWSFPDLALLWDDVLQDTKPKLLKYIFKLSSPILHPVTALVLALVTGSIDSVAYPVAIKGKMCPTYLIEV